MGQGGAGLGRVGRGGAGLGRVGQGQQGGAGLGRAGCGRVMTNAAYLGHCYRKGDSEFFN